MVFSFLGVEYEIPDQVVRDHDFKVVIFKHEDMDVFDFDFVIDGEAIPMLVNIKADGSKGPVWEDFGIRELIA